MLPIVNISTSAGSLPCLDSNLFPNNYNYDFTLIYPEYYDYSYYEAENEGDD